MPRRRSTHLLERRHLAGAGGAVLRLIATPGFVIIAGRFRDYGQILIIAHGGGYHTLIAGPWRIDASVNRWPVANEPVGVMSLTQSDNTKLYLEMRRNCQPINPLPPGGGEKRMKVNG